MPVTLQPQRVPLGTLRIGEREYPVTITLEWYRALQRLAGQAATGSGDTGSGVGGGGSSGGTGGGSTADDDAIDLANGVEPLDRVLAMALEQGLQALASQSDVPRLRAEVARLAARVDGMEQSA